ncbi:MAG: hypothetical protein FWE97_04315 [Dehalococcoidia bacterium]|nr:hypothetical protein [Dehalococcoidia bacterium]
MSDSLDLTRETTTESNEHQTVRPLDKRPLWKTAALIAILLAATGLTIFSSITFEAANKYSPLIEWPTPPTYTGEAPVHIGAIQEAWNSNNNLVLVITPCGDDALNDSIISITIQAANSIRSKDRIYVGVFVLPQDSSLSYPIVVLRLYTEAAQNFRVTMVEDITENRIHNNYLDRKFLRA